MFNYSIYRSQKIPVTAAEAWDFFSVPQNLKYIAPPYTNFTVLTTNKLEQAYAGQIICYSLTPLFGIPLFWMSEISHVRHGEFFVDEARHGPFAFWHHQHFIHPIDGGVMIEDWLHYKLPFGVVGALAHWLLIKRRLLHIFDYREQKIMERFGKWPGA